MKNHLLKKVTVFASVGLLVMLSGCGGSSGDSGNDFSAVVESSDFTFPSVNETDGTFGISAPQGNTPSFSARRTLEAGSGNTIEFNDPVVLRYEMFSWSTGELVESSNDLDEPITVRAGTSEGTPEYLSHSLLGRKIGEKMQIIFEAGTDDLPEHLDPSDAYVVVLELI